MNLGIVGHEAAKFTVKTEAKARAAIVEAINDFKADTIISGGCHLGGIDIWAVEEAKKLGKPYIEYLPKSLTWTHYKARNIQIAENSDVVICIAVKEYPANYKGMRFGFCYHCKDKDHIKSGGCWTVKYAQGIGKVGGVRII